MKILIMGFAKIKYMPYINFYLDNLDKIENKIHVLYWNRDLKEEDTKAFESITLHEFRCYQEDDTSKLSKLGSFRKYRSFVLDTLKSDTFDFIIFLHSLPGVLIADELKKHYTGKYIFDYRDSTYERFPPFKKVIAELVQRSYATFVSSDAFRKYLPESESNKIFTSHNLLLNSLDHRDEKIIYGNHSDKIRIAFWGFIRHEDINLTIIKKIAQDDRFELHYYGREQQIALNLKQYVADNRIRNVFFHGEYKPKDRYEFVRNTDIIHNIYYDNNTMLAMGNKYYDGIIFRIPQICMPGSYMGKRCTNAGIGLECEPSASNFTDEIYEYYKKISWKRFADACDNDLNQILQEYDKGAKVIKAATLGEVK